MFTSRNTERTDEGEPFGPVKELRAGLHIFTVHGEEAATKHLGVRREAKRPAALAGWRA